MLFVCYEINSVEKKMFMMFWKLLLNRTKLLNTILMLNLRILRRGIEIVFIFLFWGKYTVSLISWYSTLTCRSFFNLLIVNFFMLLQTSFVFIITIRTYLIFIQKILSIWIYVESIVFFFFFSKLIEVKMIEKTF